MPYEKRCKICNALMEWQHPILKDHIMESSCNMEGNICYDCINEHCEQTNCLQCDWYSGDYKKCQYFLIKNPSTRFLCENKNCVFFKDDACVIPEEENLFNYDKDGNFLCVNHITDVNQVCKEARKKYNL
ncbi:MAG: hypothetical protein IJT36_03260 [Alphaproteobacteria bacterium]|nr:hypothetical protein [Alphaproteobacteria bacterium]